MLRAPRNRLTISFSWIGHGVCPLREVPKKLRRLGWNRRVLTFDDFHDACEAEGIYVRPVPLDCGGLYLTVENTPVILLDERLREPRRSFVAWHEYGHHLWHTPGRFGRHAKTELEADLIAHVALIPVFLLNLPDGEIGDFFGYDAGMIRTRVKIFQTFGV
jgi:Zn-dependent peptidase ImmA (M78 family)